MIKYLVNGLGPAKPGCSFGSRLARGDAERAPRASWGHGADLLKDELWFGKDWRR